MRKGANYTIIEKVCNINKLDCVFPSFACITIHSPEAARASFISSDILINGASLRVTSRDGSPSQNRELHHNKGESLLISG
ncbi:hypothetical protein POVCU2_0079450 [Plasmodium ovale curtisi]|uniref:Uncharacterized protein n=1 Tax=Plasmodium ovale curtisi TaxID=864141 RepID=A0A1A8WJR2_PLAOA|nr:hypothetical protein POVCU2_0079450 [Plasmodium ovale curtisi]SBT02715.1 hypothetical protein POVCU1_079980 [Plasmodium ovale curtisi]